MENSVLEKKSKSFLASFVKNFKSNISEFIPLFGFIGVIIFFAVTTQGLSLSAFNIKILINQGVILAIIATGATFEFTMGAFDISLGAITCLASVIGAMTANVSGSPIIMLIACLVCAVAISIVNGACIAVFKLPSFIVTLATMNIMAAVVSLLLGLNSMITVTHDFSYLDTTNVKLLVLIIMMALSILMFNYNKLGRADKIIGGNSVVAVQSGISILKSTIYTFILSGIGIGLGAFLLLIRTSSVSTQTGSAFGFDLIIAIVLGGMPISGGARSKITSAIIGAFTVTALNNGLVILGVSTGVLQAVRGILFLLVVALMAMKTRGKFLIR